MDFRHTRVVQYIEMAQHRLQAGVVAGCCYDDIRINGLLVGQANCVCLKAFDCGHDADFSGF